MLQAAPTSLAAANEAQAAALVPQVALSAPTAGAFDVPMVAMSGSEFRSFLS